MTSFFKIPNPLSLFKRKSRVNDNTLDENFMVDGTDIKWEDTVPFIFPVKGGRVIKVYDADTITIASKLPHEGSPIYRLSIRLNGIDTPEIKGKNISDDEKNAAIEARDFVSNLVLNKFVRLENVNTEKYGRILADVYIGNTHLNELLIKDRFAVSYDGGTKKKPTSWLKYKINGEI
jgi:endonuclease YncB( thermonuclease family)